MKKYCIAIFLMLVWLGPAKAAATTPPALAVPSGLALAEVKITGSEFVMLLNNSGSTITDLSKYWLYVFNNVNPLAPGVSSSTQQLPTVSLAAGQTVLLSANGGATCGAAVSGKLSISLNDSGGFLEVVQTSLVGGVVVQTAGDAVSWTTGSNSTDMISSVPTSTATKETYVAYRYQNGSPPPNYKWQAANIDTSNPCQLTVSAAQIDISIISPLLPGDPPPISFANDSELTGSSANGGLKAPVINELLPNPAEPQTDSEDEFIEIYNSNDVAFDLNGYKLQTGITSLRSYTFPAGTMLPAKSFTAFYSADTNLSLSNSGSQAKLLDPSGNVVSQSDSYSSAAEGQSWALANGKWNWTKTVTPNQTNVINSPSTASVTSNSKKTARCQIEPLVRAS